MGGLVTNYSVWGDWSQTTEWVGGLVTDYIVGEKELGGGAGHRLYNGCGEDWSQTIKWVGRSWEGGLVTDYRVGGKELGGGTGHRL